MILDLVAVLVRDIVLKTLDFLAREFNHLAGVDVDHVIVMLAPIDFVHRLPALEIVLEHEAGGLELGQDAVDGGQADIVVMFEQAAIDVLGSEMPAGRGFEDFEYAQARMRDLEAGLA